MGAKYTVCPTHFSTYFIIIICWRAVLQQIKVRFKGKKKPQQRKMQFGGERLVGRRADQFHEEWESLKAKHIIYMTPLNLYNTLSW